MPNQARLGGSRQTASKVSHSAFVDNPDIQDFLSSCTFMREPNDEERAAILSRFITPPTASEDLPDYIIAIDGSPYESNFHRGLPSTRAGYLKVSGVAVSVPRYRAASDSSRRFVDPFEMAAIYEQKDALTVCLPSSNMSYGSTTSVKHGFRLKLFEEFCSEKTRIMQGQGHTFLDTLYRLAEFTPTSTADEGGDDRGKGGRRDGGRFIRVHRCSWCGLKPVGGFLVPQDPGKVVCGECHSDGCDGPIYATDVLRVHESVTTQGPNLEALTRTMNVLEAVFLAHLIVHLSEASPRALSRGCFVVDGPLAIFGESAWMHGGLLRLFWNVQDDLKERGLSPFLLFGIQKTGQVAEHAAMIRPFLATDREAILLITDEYRAEFVKEREDNLKNFGDETYWGQDFLYRAENGDMFVLGLPYPTPTKRVADPSGRLSAELYFRQIKGEMDRYDQLGRVLDVVRVMKSDLYESSLVPVLAAHREASISLMPGGRVLDLMSLSAFFRGAAT